MKRIIDRGNWKRKEHFEFFDQCEEPYFGVVSSVDISKAYNRVKVKGESLYLDYLHKSMLAVNEIPEFKTRIEESNIVEYELIHVSATVYKENDTFGFSFIPFNTDFNKFALSANSLMEEARKIPGIGYTDENKRIDTIHCSAIPWFSFTGLSHPRFFKVKDSVPKISFGKYEKVNGRLEMPVSIHSHHGLMDGSHVGHYLTRFQKFLNE